MTLLDPLLLLSLLSLLLGAAADFLGVHERGLSPFFHRLHFLYFSAGPAEVGFIPPDFFAEGHLPEGQRYDPI
jgi:hypothetical protein